LDARVAIHRPDVIGMLARSFNEMVKQVKRQKDDLREANARLEQANAQLEQANARLGHSNDRLGEANSKLAEANRDLEQKVQQRTVQLEAANKRLSSEIAEKEDFLRAVSHDLNAPLRNISGMATMLLMKHRETFAEDVIHRLERIQKNVEVETDLIGELLELSRIKTRRQKIETVDLNSVLRELADVFAQDLESRQIRLVVDAPLPALDCERARLRQVFQNLIDNAIKYMGEGSPAEGPAAEGAAAAVKEIHVGCTVRADEAEFYVRDTGIGIEADDLDKLFRVFRRGKNSAVHGVPGKGVGLASVKSIVETYSGTIWVESQLGRGSTFRFTINGKHVSAPPAGGARAA
jgi:signal transduction histidine kinase